MMEFKAVLEEKDDIAVLCLLSHGSRDQIYGCDGKTVKIADITGALNNINCRIMAGKPKIIINQACQGGMYVSLYILFHTSMLKSTEL